MIHEFVDVNFGNDRTSVVQLFQNFGQVAKSSIFVCSNFSENRRWPTWDETTFSYLISKPQGAKFGCCTELPRLAIHRMGYTGINWELYLRNIALLHSIRIKRTVSEHARIAQK